MRTKKRILSILLTVCLIVGLFPTTAFAAETDTGKAIQLGTNGISGYDSTNGHNYIYMGYWTAPDNYTTSGPIKWRVLDTKTNMDGAIDGDGLFLLSDVLLGTGRFGDLYFNSVNGRNVWQNSSAQTWCKDFAGIEGSSVTDAFTAGELGAVLATTKSDGQFTSSTGSVPFSASDNILNGDKVFFLSAEEAENEAYGFTDDNARLANYGTSAGTWWLRSPCALGTPVAGAVENTGSVYYYSAGDYFWAARPAFNLDPDSVLFTSAADNTGHNSSFTAPADYSGSEWKVTLKDGNDFANGASVSSTTALSLGYSDTELTINHAALDDFNAGYTNVTAMLTNSSGEILYYGSINNSTSATESTITIPAGLAAGDYTLSVYGEDWNDAKYTDYATRTPFTTTITVHAHSWGTDWRSDSTHHWHECENSDCPVTDDSSKDGYTTHSFTVETVKDEALKSAANCTDPATYYKSCECGAVSTSDTDTFTSGSTADHSWATDWNRDSTHHWHECENSNCPVTDNSSKDGYTTHSFTVETVKDEALKSAANCTDPATYYKSCECGAVSTSDTDTFTSGSAAGHSWATDWNSDSTHHWHECENSDCPVTDNSGKDGYAAHSFTLETVKDEALKSAANCTDPATYYKSCECGAVSTSDTDIFTSGSAAGHSWATSWNSDSTHHWHECENSNCPVTDNSSKDGYTTHSFTLETVKDEALKSAANCDDPATYYKSCECGAVSTSDTDTFTSGSAAGHSWATSWNSDSTHHWHECGNSNCPVTDNSGKDGYAEHTPGAEATEDTPQICTICEYVITPELGHEHNYSAILTYDSTGHWYSCTCSEKKDFAAHSFDDACDTDCNDGCGYTRSTTHSYGTDWSKDASGHWHECSVCHDKKDNATHTPGAAATEDTPQICTVCGYEIAPASGHTHSWGGWISSGDGTHTRTCSTNSNHTENGNCSGGTATCKSPAACTVCGQTYGSTNSSNHTDNTAVRGEVEATPTTAGYTGDTYCLDCNTKIKTGTTIPATGSGGGGTGGSTGGGDSGNDDNGDDTPPATDDGDDTPSDTPADTPATPVTVPVSGDENTIQVGASVSGTTATIDDIDLSTLNTVIGDDVKTGVVTVDFSILNVEVDTVEIPADVVKQIAAAVNDPNNDAESLEIVLTDGTSIEFDAKALGEKSAQAGGIDITISIKHTTDSALNNRQQQTVGNRPAYDINVTSGGKHISDMGGKVTVHAPYELRPGEKAEGIVVFYVDDNGNRERCETSYDSAKRRVNWKTDHLSVYMIGYEEPPKSPDTGDNTPAYVTHTVQKGDTLWAIAKKYGCTVSEIVAANSDLIKDPDLIYAGWQLKIPQADKKTTVYIVKQGDTLWAISKKYGCTVAEIIALNDKLITDPDLIFAGWELKIPQE